MCILWRVNNFFFVVYANLPPKHHEAFTETNKSWTHNTFKCKRGWEIPNAPLGYTFPSSPICGRKLKLNAIRSVCDPIPMPGKDNIHSSPCFCACSRVASGSCLERPSWIHLMSHIHMPAMNSLSPQTLSRDPSRIHEGAWGYTEGQVAHFQHF